MKKKRKIHFQILLETFITSEINEKIKIYKLIQKTIFDGEYKAKIGI